MVMMRLTTIVHFVSIRPFGRSWGCMRIQLSCHRCNDSRVDQNLKCLISDEHPLPDDGIVPTRIYTHNRDVDSENEARLAELDGELISFKAIDKWREEMPKETLATIKKGMKVSVGAELPDDVELKIGAQVMLTRNKDLDRGLVNGSRGVVQDFHSF